jgi:hypothetical protein
MESYHVELTNGSEHRRLGVPVFQPDIEFAVTEAQRWAPDAFRMPWNRVADSSKWRIAVTSTDGKQRHEEPVRV